MSAQIVDLAERRRVRELADALAAMAHGRVEDLIALQHLMLDHPDECHDLLRQVVYGHTTLAEAARAARQRVVRG